MANGVQPMANQKFGRLMVVSFSRIKNHKAFWDCICDCGNRAEVEGKKMRVGHTLSCGCIRKEKAAERQLIHGHARRIPSATAKRAYSREYQAWQNLRFRVLNPKSEDYSNYGGRGITICDRWKKSFVNFYADMGPCPEKLEIDRINVNGNYEPSNCRWTDELTQSRNRRKHNG